MLELDKRTTPNGTTFTVSRDADGDIVLQGAIPGSTDPATFLIPAAERAWIADAIAARVPGGTYLADRLLEIAANPTRIAELPALAAMAARLERALDAVVREASERERARVVVPFARGLVTVGSV